MGVMPLGYPLRLAKSRERNRAGPLRYSLCSPKSREQNWAGHQRLWLCPASCAVVSPLAFGRCHRAAVVVFVVVENVIV